MQKVFGMLCIVAGIWVGLEVYQKGMAGAFDGAFVRFGMADEPAPDAGPYRPAGERAAARVRSAYQTGMDRGDFAEQSEGRAASAAERTAERARGMADR